MQEKKTDPKKVPLPVKDPTLELLQSLDYDSNMAQTPMGRTVDSGSGDMYGYNTGLGASRFDENLSPASQIEFDDFLTSLEDYRSKQQSDLLKSGALLGRIGTKVAAEISKMPGILGGVAVGTAGQVKDLVTGEDNTDFVQTAFNNLWVNAIQGIEEEIKEDVLPVYVKKAVKEGNLWDNISSIDFWATEGADGAGYILSMLVPGAVINKYGVGAKMLGTNKLAQMAAKMDDADMALKSMKSALITGKNADLATATFANTLFESAAESKSAMDAMTQELEYRNSLDPDDPNYLSDENLALEMEKVSKVGRNVFVANFGILLGPNAIMSKMLWGKTRNRAPEGLLKNNKLQTIVDPKLSVKAGRVGKDFLYAGGREGFWEEGMQSTAENYFTENPDSNMGDFIGDIGKAYIDMFATTEGQKAIFLGAFFGGGMQSVMGAKNRKRERVNTNKLIEAGNTMLTDFYNVFNEDIYEKDEQGNVVFTEEMVDNELTRSPKIDQVKMLNKLASINELEKLSALYDLAVETDNKEQIKQIKDILVTNLIKPFIVNDNIGIDVLEQHLKESSDLAAINEREGTDNQEFISDVITRAKKLKKDYIMFEDFGSAVFDLTNENASKQEVVDFYNKLASQYLDTKSRKYYIEKELAETEETYSELLQERGRELSDIENNRLRRDLKTQDSRINKIDSKYTELKKQLEKTNNILNAFWDGKSTKAKFDTEIKNKRAVEKELAEVEELSNEIADKFKAAQTIEELEEIEIPDNAAKVGLEAKKNERIKELEAIIAEKAEEATKGSEAFNEQETNRSLEEQEALDYIKDNYNVGEEITLPAIDAVPVDMQGMSATIDAIGDQVDVTLESGQKISIKPNSFIDIVKSSVEANFRSEGGTDVVQTTEEDATSKLYEDRNQPRIVITDNNKGNKLDFVDQAALDFERTPRDKTGESKNIEVNSNNSLSENQIKALEMFNANDFSDINFLIDHLPLNIKLTDTVSAPLETKSEKSKAYNDIFNKTSREIRTSIIKELANGISIDAITVEIAGQTNGQIQLTSPVEENGLEGLYEFGGNIDNIKIEDIYFVDDFGTLVNSEDDIFSTRRALAPGEIYLKIHTAAGKAFPLKLNVAKINERQAELLYDLYKYRFEADEKEGELKRISTLEPQLFENIKESFSDVLDLFGKNVDDITVKDLVDLMVWEGSKSVKSQLKFTKSGKLLLLDKSFNQEEFNSVEGKQKFIDVLTSNKRHQIKFKRKATDSNDLNISENRKYLEYLIRNKILNTNAIIGAPTFQGKTTMYLDKTSVKVNGQPSKYNSDIKKTYSKRLVGTNTQLQKVLPGLFKNSFTLTEDETAYVDQNRVRYKRATSLKDKPFNPNDLRLYNAAKRGDVVDELVRLYFSKYNLSKQEFIKRGKSETAKINKDKPKTTVEISENYFNSLYDILEKYKEEFDNQSLTIYSNAPTLGGTIGVEGKIAGTMDLLAYDNANKKWVMIDLKTSTSDRALEYTKENDPEYVKKKGYSYRAQDEVQLNTYKELFRQSTGQTIEDLRIMPLTSKSEDTDQVNGSYFDLSMSKRGFFLNVNSTDIYNLLSIKKTEAPKKDEEDGETEEEANTRKTQGNRLLSKFGIKVEEVPEAKEVPKAKPKEKVNIISLEEMTTEALNAVENSEYTSFVYNKKNYILTFNFYVIDANNSQLITDPKQTERIVNEYNKQAIAQGKINLETLREVWKKRVAEAEETSKIEQEREADVLDTDKLSEAKAKEIFMKLVKNFKVYVKEMNALAKKFTNTKDKVKAIIQFLKDKNISEEQIKTKCNL